MNFSVTIKLRSDHIDLINFIFEKGRVHRRDLNYLVAIELLREGVLAKNSENFLWLTNIGKKIYYLIQMDNSQKTVL